MDVEPSLQTVVYKIKYFFYDYFILTVSGLDDVRSIMFVKDIYVKILDPISFTILIYFLWYSQETTHAPSEEDFLWIS